MHALLFRRLLVGLLLLQLPTFSFAQEDEKLPLYIGPTVGFNICQAHIKSAFQPGTSSLLTAKAGMVALYGITAQLQMMHMLKYSGWGYQQTGNLSDYIFRVNYLNYTFLMMYRYRLSTSLALVAGLGIYTAYALNAYDKYNGSKYDYKIGNSDDDDIARWDYGPTFRLGVQFALLSTLLQANVYYQLGMANLYPDGNKDNALRARIIGLQLYWMFNFNRLTGREIDAIKVYPMNER